MKKLMVLYKVAVAVLVFTAIAVQLTNTLQNHFGVVNFFSYFTIEANVFSAAVLLASAIFLARNKENRTLSYLRGAAALYMVMVGVVYSFLLSGGNDGMLYAWVNMVVHYLFPVVMALDWLIDRAQPAVRLKKALWWMAFPLAFVAYSLLRGPIVQWYPYPFLDSREQGYLPVALTSAGLVIGALALIFIVVKYTQLHEKIARPRRPKPKRKVL